MIENTSEILRKAQKIINLRIQERIEIDRRRKGNIQVYFSILKIKILIESLIS